MKKRRDKKDYSKIVKNYYIYAPTYIQNSTIDKCDFGGNRIESPQSTSATQNESTEKFWGDLKKRAITAAMASWRFAEPLFGRVLSLDKKEILPPAMIVKTLFDNRECLSNFMQVIHLCN